MTTRMPLCMALLAAGICSHAQVIHRATTVGVRISARVASGGVPVLGLHPEDFEVTDDGVPQRIDTLESADRVAVTIVLDSSLSMRGQGFKNVLVACDTLIGALKPGDRAALVSVSDHANLEVPLTDDLGTIRSSFAGAQALGFGAIPVSAIWDGVLSAAAAFDDEDGWRLIVVITDGLDNSSWLTEPAASEALVDLGVTVDWLDAPGPRRCCVDTPDAGPLVSNPLTGRTGGERFSATDRSLAGKFANRLAGLRQSYLLTYIPTGVRRDDRWHPLKIKVKRPGATVKARPGYFAGRPGGQL